MKRYAFTMIELIFVIVILGILAAVAIPKLAATRDDAKITIALQHVSIALSDIANHYTGTGSLLLTVTDAPTSGGCFSFTLDDNNSDGADDSVIIGAVPGDAAFCPDAIARAASINLMGTHVFAGTQVSY